MMLEMMHVKQVAVRVASPLNSLLAKRARLTVLAPAWALVVAVLLAGAMLSLLGNVRPAAAQSSEDGFVLPPGVTWDQVNNIARKMYCDVCQGVPLDECESAACQQWREEIARQLGQGRTENEIIDYFVQRYGADVAALPRDKNDRLLVFAVPISLVLVIGVVGAFQVRNLRQRGRQAGPVTRRSVGRLQSRPVPDDIDPELLERLERELEGLDS
jgi:cytochrome c-type biogenesis protein CcmH